MQSPDVYIMIRCLCRSLMQIIIVLELLCSCCSHDSPSGPAIASTAHARGLKDMGVL